jgi:hypothetical protein
MAFRHLIEQLRLVHNLAGTTILGLVVSRYIGCLLKGCVYRGSSQIFTEGFVQPQTGGSLGMSCGMLATAVWNVLSFLLSSAFTVFNHFAIHRDRYKLVRLRILELHHMVPSTRKLAPATGL